MAYIQIGDITDKLCLAFESGGTYEIESYFSMADTEINVLAEELGVDPDDIDTDYKGELDSSTGRVHPRLIDYGACYCLMWFFFDRAMLGNDEYDKYYRKYESYREKASKFRTSITAKMLTDNVSDTSDLSINSQVIYHG